MKIISAESVKQCHQHAGVIEISLHLLQTFTWLVVYVLNKAEFLEINRVRRLDQIVRIPEIIRRCSPADVDSKDLVCTQASVSVEGQ